MFQEIALVGHASLGPMTARATLQVRPAGVVVDPTPAVKYLRLENPLRWSKEDLSCFAAFAMFLSQVVLLIDRFIN